MLGTARSPEDIRAALAATSPEDPRLRAGLLARYQQLAANGPKLDPTTTVRSEILIALREAVLPADLDLLETAAITYEVGYGGELAGPLRAAAVVAMVPIDPVRASLHAVRLLADGRNTNEMSGEPALSAAKVLAARGETLAIYSRALADGNGGEVLGECLRSLTGLPAQLALLLAAKHAENRDEAVLLGLADLVLGHPDPAVAANFLPGWLSGLASEDLFRYIATAAVASRREDLRRVIVGLAAAEVRRERRAILEEALAL